MPEFQPEPEAPDAAPRRSPINRQRRRLYEPLTGLSAGAPTSRSAKSGGADASKSFLPGPKPEPDHQRRYNDAQHLILDYAMWSAGTGLMPAPFVDMIAMLAIELRMVQRLSALYGLPFSKARGKALVAALLGSVHAGLWTGSCLKLVPFFGLAGVVLPMVAISGGLTYAIGQVFVQHFESGGTLLNFRPEKMRRYYAQQFEKGRHIVTTQRTPSE